MALVTGVLAGVIVDKLIRHREKIRFRQAELVMYANLSVIVKSILTSTTKIEIFYEQYFRHICIFGIIR
jgi:hypothetical protein